MKIYIAMHKLEDRFIENPIYKPLLVGSYNKISENVLRDDEGENISSKNSNYCELTGLYWIWKNISEDIVGLCHYRRFLTKNGYSKAEKFFLNENDIVIDIKENNIDLILPQKTIFKGCMISESSTAPNQADMDVVKSVIKEKCPEYIKAYDQFVNGKSAYLCNVMIAPKNIFNEYCSWLFDILFEVEKRLDKDSYINSPYRKRIFGFISERLLNIWIIHNLDRLKIKEYFMVNISQNVYQRMKGIIIQKIRNLKSD